MLIKMLKSKIHRAVVTEANLDYEGSISIDENLITAAKLQPYEKVHVLDITNGNRVETYVIKAPAGSKAICINGAAAHLIKPKDTIIILSYCSIEHESPDEGGRQRYPAGCWPSAQHAPVIVKVNHKNEIID